MRLVSHASHEASRPISACQSYIVLISDNINSTLLFSIGSLVQLCFPCPGANNVVLEQGNAFS